MRPVFFKRDCWIVGVLMGIVLPVLFYLFLYLVNLLTLSVFDTGITVKHHLLFLLAFIVNLFPIRYYLIKLNYEKTGLGLLLITIIGIILYFYLFYQK